MSIPILTDEQIATLAPHHLAAGAMGPEAGEDARESFLRIYTPLRDGGTSDYFLSRVATALYTFRPLLGARLAPTRAKHVLELGCGEGWKALAWADLFASYVGVDLDREAIDRGSGRLRQFGVDNARLLHGNAEALLREPERHGLPERVDLLVLYAVLEHLTLPERRSILRLAQDVLRRGGHVLIAETPNRLSPFDTHSFQVPFIEWLPPELQVEYASRSPREDLKSRLAAAPPDGKQEALYRIGRGLSFHEFECYWDPETYEGLSALLDGFSAPLLNMEPLRHDEADLMAFCRDNGVDIHRMFQRYWFYGLLAPRPEGHTGRSAQYLTPAQLAPGAPVQRRPPHWALDEVTIRPGDGAALTIPDAGSPADEAILLVNLETSSGILSVEQGPADGADPGPSAARTIDLATIARSRMPTWHNLASLPLGPARGRSYRIRVEPADGPTAQLTCQGALLA